MLRERNQDSVAAQNARLFAGNGGDGAAQPFGVVERDVGDDGKKRVDDIGGVETSAHAHFEHGDIDMRLGEVKQRLGGEDLKKTGKLGKAFVENQLLRCIVDVEIKPRKDLVVDFDAIKANALIHAGQVGRGVKAGAQTGGGEDGGQRCCSGAFAVGARDEHGGKAAMRVAEGGEQDANLSEREFAPGLAGALVELGNHGVELIDGSGVGHGQSSIEARSQPRSGLMAGLCLALAFWLWHLSDIVLSRLTSRGARYHGPDLIFSLALSLLQEVPESIDKNVVICRPPISFASTDLADPVYSCPFFGSETDGSPLGILRNVFLSWAHNSNRD